MTDEEMRIGRVQKPVFGDDDCGSWGLYLLSLEIGRRDRLMPSRAEPVRKNNIWRKARLSDLEGKRQEDGQSSEVRRELTLLVATCLNSCGSGSRIHHCPRGTTRLAKVDCPPTRPAGRIMWNKVVGLVSSTVVSSASSSSTENQYTK